MRKLMRWCCCGNALQQKLLLKPGHRNIKNTITNVYLLTQYQILNRSNSIHPCMVRIYQGLHWCILETLLLSSLKFWPADTAVSFTHRVYLVCTVHVHSLPTVIPGVLSLSRRETICSATSFLHYTNWPWVGTTWSDCLNKKKTSGLII